MPQILKRVVLSALISCALVVVGASTAMALPYNRTDGRTGTRGASTNTNKKQDRLCQQASVVREKVVKQFNKRTPGRKICKYGLRGGRKPSTQQIERYLQTLKRMIAPPATPQTEAASVSSTLASAGASSYSSTGGGTVPACASESGTNYSTGPSNTNPTSGATGRYQIIPSTHAALCSDLGWSPADQDECAQRIYEAQGSGAWVGCGG